METQLRRITWKHIEIMSYDGKRGVGGGGLLKRLWRLEGGGGGDEMLRIMERSRGRGNLYAL